MKNPLFIFAVPILLAGQTSSPTATFEGTVVDAATGQPVAGARLASPMVLKAVTGADGRFQITGLSPGTYTLSANRSGFLSSTQNVKLESGQTLANWRVELVRAGEVSGKVEDQDGWPAEGCEMEALHYVYHEGKRELERAGSAQTNDLGEYWIGGLKPGRYFVRATAYGGLAFWDKRYGVTFHPSAASMSAAEAIDLTPGQPHAAVNVRMLRRQGVRLTGEVVMPETGGSFHPPADVSLVCEDAGVSPCIAGHVVKDAFTIEGVPPGSYTLQARGWASASNGNEPPLAAYQRIEVGTTDMNGFVLTLGPQPPRDLAATVTFEANVKPKEMWFHLQPVSASTVTEQLRPDGSLVFHNILPGHYNSINFYGSDTTATMFYLKSARLGDEDILDREFDIPNETGGQLQLTVGAISTVRIQGVVTDASGGPVGEATVAYVPTTPRTPYSAGHVIADQTGAFEFSAPAGEYRMAAWHSAVPLGPIEEPEFLQQQEVQTVLLKPGANPPLKLSLR